MSVYICVYECGPEVVEVRGQPVKVRSLLPLPGLGFELWLPSLHNKDFYALDYKLPLNYVPTYALLK